MDELGALEAAPAAIHEIVGHGGDAATDDGVAATPVCAVPDTTDDAALGRRRSHRRVETFSSGPKHRARAKPRKRNATGTDDDLEIVPAPEGLADSNDWHCSVCGQLVSPMFKATLGQVLPLAGGEPVSDTPAKEVDSPASDASDLLLSCDGGCMRSFHTSCLALPQDELDRIVAGPADAPWTCADCAGGSHACTLCGRADAVEYAPILRWGAVDSVSDAAWLVRHSPWLQAAAKSGAAAAARGAGQRRSSDGGAGDPSRASAIAVGRALQSALVALSRDDLRGGGVTEGDATPGSAADDGADAATARVHARITSSAVCSALTAACGPDPVSSCLASLEEVPQVAAAAAAAAFDFRPAVAALLEPLPPSDCAPPAISAAGKRRRQQEPSGGSGTVDAEAPVQAQGLAAALAESIVTQAFAAVPAPIRHSSPPLAGAPESLVGTPWEGGAPRKCVDWRCGRRFHWACLRRLADGAAADLDRRLHESALRQRAVSRMHAESLLAVLRTAVEERAALAAAAADAAAKARERLAQSASPSPAAPRKYHKKKHADAAALVTATAVASVAAEPASSDALGVSDGADIAAIDATDGTSVLPEGQAALLPPAASDLLPDVKNEGGEPSESTSAAPTSPTAVVVTATKTATGAARGRKVARLPQQSSSAALRATGTRRLSLTGEGSCGPFAADPVLRLAAAQAAAEETARRAAVAADVVRIFRGEAVQLNAAEDSEDPRSGTPAAELSGAVDAQPDPAGEDTAATGEAEGDVSRATLRRRSRSLASPAGGRGPQRSRQSRPRRRPSDGAALSTASPLLDSLMRPWRSQEPEAALPVYISCRDLLPKTPRRHTAATGSDDAAGPAPTSAAMQALEAFAKSDIAGVRRLLHRVGIDPPASWRPPHAAPSAPAVATRRGGKGMEDAACTAPALPPGLRQFELSVAEADSASMEAVWLAPGVCGDFVCPTHCCDVCEGGQGGAAAGVFGVGALDAINSATPLVAPSLPSRLAIDFSSSALLSHGRSPTTLLAAPVLTKSNRPRKGWVMELVPVQPASAATEEALPPPRKASRRRSVQDAGGNQSELPAGEASSQPVPPGEASAATSTPAASPPSRPLAAAATTLPVPARTPALQSGQSPLVLLLYAEGALAPVRMAVASPAQPKALRGLAPGAATVAAASEARDRADGSAEAIVVEGVEGMDDAVIRGSIAEPEQQLLVALPGEPSLAVGSDDVAMDAGNAVVAIDHSAAAPAPGEAIDALMSPAGVSDDTAGESAVVEDNAAAGDGGDNSDAEEADDDDGTRTAAAKQPVRQRKRRRGSRVGARKSPTKRPRGAAGGGDGGADEEAPLPGDAADVPEDAVAVADDPIADPGSAVGSPFVALARAWLRREPPHATPRLLIVEPSRAALVRRLLCGRHRGRLPVRCMHCPRAYHADCAPPDVALNEYAALCASHAAQRLPGEDDDGDGDSGEAAPAEEEAVGPPLDDNAEAGNDTEADAPSRSRKGSKGRRRPAAGAASAPPPAVDRSLLAAQLLAASRSGAAKLRSLALPPTAPVASAREDRRHFRLPAPLRDEAASKPPPYVHIVRNIYTIRVKPQWPDSEPCSCGGGGGGGGGASSSRGGAAAAAAAAADLAFARFASCGDGCVNRLLRVECSGVGLGDAAADTSADAPAAAAAAPGGATLARAVRERVNCSVGPRCGNRCLQERSSPPLVLSPTPGKGWGVLAGADIPAGSFIVEYVGEIVDEATQARRLTAAAARGEHHAYIMEIDANQFIDARFKSNLARFLNHSCAPNCELQRWSVDGLTRIGIFALEDVRRGEELCYDYQFFTAATTRCGCGAATCRGYLGANVARDKAGKAAGVGSVD